ncbi:hypothetical protein JOM56_009282 [Amanita muscaria]
MHLKSGIYIISSKANGLHIGRHPREDRSLRPKVVLTLPADVQAPKVWRVEKLPDDVYKLSTLGSYATEINEKVFAVLQPEPEPTEWTIKLRGKNIYTYGFLICNDHCLIRELPESCSVQAPSGKGWVIPENEPETQHYQIIIRHLIVGPSDPPHFPSNQLFEFVRVDRD